MDLDYGTFERFAKQRLQTAAFKTNAKSGNSHIFHTSLESTQAQFNWTQGSTNKQGGPFNLVAGFLDTFSPNALADCYEGTHFIGMHVALFVAINEFSMFCFAQKDFFPDIGDASQENSPAPWDDRVPGLWLIDHTAHGGHVRDKHSRRLIPKDSMRYQMSLYLGLLMSRFVWLHELAHCFNGHIAYVHHHNLALRLYELSPQEPITKMNIVESASIDSGRLKCLEFDADQSAIWASCNIQLRGLENIQGIQGLDEKLRIRLTLFGSYAMTWLFEQFQNYCDTKNGATHPDPLLRLSNLLRTAKSNIIPLHRNMAALNNNAIMQFDGIRQRIPGIYESDELEAIIGGSERATSLSEFEEMRESQKIALQEFQFHQNPDHS